MKDKVYEYIRDTKKVYIPQLCLDLGIDKEIAVDAIINVWEKLEHPYMFNNMLYVSNLYPANYYEVCDTERDRGNYIREDKLPTYIETNRKENQHQSVFKHDTSWSQNVKQTGSVSCSNTIVGLDWLPIELDRESLTKAMLDAAKIYTQFPYQNRMKLWYSGNKSIHIMVHTSLFGNIYGDQEQITGMGKLCYRIAERICGDVRYGNGLTDPYFLKRNEVYTAYANTFKERPDLKRRAQDYKQKLENFDPNLFNVNSLIRLPYSKHERGKKYKTLLSINDLLNKEISQNKTQESLDIVDKNPYLIHWVHELYKPKRKEAKENIIPIEDKGKIQRVLDEIFGDEIEYEMANHNGWINNLLSPFYDDDRASVAVNIKRGYYKDFGEPDDTFDLYELYSKFKGISKRKAKKIIESWN